MNKMTILTSCAPFVDDRIPIQQVGLYSFSQVENAKVIVLGDDLGVEEQCKLYGYQQIKNIPIGRDIGVEASGGILMGAGFESAKPFIEGEMVLFINADNILMPIASIFYEAVEVFGDDFAGFGRRLNMDGWEKHILDCPEASYRSFIDYYVGNILVRNRPGIDVYLWSSKLFQALKMPNFVIDGWCWDIWMGQNIYDSTKNSFYLSGVLDTIHPNHKIGHQVEEHKPCSTYNRALVKRHLKGMTIFQVSQPELFKIKGVKDEVM